MEVNSWNELLLFLAGGLALVFTNNIKSIVRWFVARNQKASKGIMAAAEVSDIIWGLLQAVDQIDRVAILRAGNGGSQPKIGKQMKASMIYNSWDKPERNKKQDYQDLSLDHEYIKMLVRVHENGYDKIIVENMVDGCMLKDIYQSEDIKYAELYSLAETEKYFYYISVATIKSPFHGPDTYNAINMAVQKLINLYKNNDID